MPAWTAENQRKASLRSRRVVPEGVRDLWMAGLLIFLGGLTACSSIGPQVPPASMGSSTPVERMATSTPVAPATIQGTATGVPTATAPPAPSPTPTPDPYAGLTIASLRGRMYGAGRLEIVETLGHYTGFTRYLIAYPSDELRLYGFMNVPEGVASPLPVVIAVHGYIDPQVYQTLDYTTRYADGLARAGYLVLHPNLRGYPPSDDGPNAFRVGMAVDVLNLLALVRRQGGLPGPLEAADPNRVGLWGHSMGGGISTRVITVDPEVRAAVLYGSMSGDETRNYTKILEWSQGARGTQELQVPAADLERIAPIHHFDRIQAAVSVHHGESDSLVPPEWSRETCERLAALEIQVACHFYPGQPHTFQGAGDQEFMERSLAFFNQYLRGWAP